MDQKKLNKLQKKIEGMSSNSLRRVYPEQMKEWLDLSDIETKEFLDELIQERLIISKYDFDCTCGNHCTVFLEKLKNSKPTITGKEVKIDKDTYDTLNQFMNTSKKVIKDIPRNQALFKELTDYTKSYKDLENEKRNIQVEVKKLEYQNEKLQAENNRLHNLIHNILQTLKQFFHRLLKIGTEKDKDDVVLGIKEYYTQNLYDNFDLHDIVNNTSKEQEIYDYLYSNEYDYDDRDIDI